jgi:hypothetical protein
MTMHSRTIAILDQLEKASWFSRVGVKEVSSVAVVTSWPEAIEQCSLDEWEDLRLGALNQYRLCVAECSMERLRLWNDTVDEVKKVTGPIVDRKITAVVRKNSLPEIFKIRVRSDITLACMEAEFADICQPGFFTGISNWYVRGHFPCGWRGVFPQGKLVIY